MALAQEAARIMSEQGIDDYGLAKRKAAERFGATDIAVLPKNTEIEAALAAHHRLFEAHTHSSTLERAAPHGAAGDAPAAAVRAAPGGTRAERHGVGALGSESAPVRGGCRTGRAASHGAGHPASDGRAPAALRAEPAGRVSRSCDFVAGDRSIDAVVFPIDGIRQSPASPVDGRPMRRADAAELEAMLRAKRRLKP